MASGKNDLANEVSHVASFLPSQGPALGLPSPLGAQMSGQKTAGKSKKDMNTPLLLTALVDAFSILVIFLLVQVQGAPHTYDADDKLKLPMAASINDTKPDSPMGERVANLVIRDGRYVLDGEIVSTRDLVMALKNIKASAIERTVRLVIQADQNSEFDLMNPLLASTAEAGIGTLEFAVRAKL